MAQTMTEDEIRRKYGMAPAGATPPAKAPAKSLERQKSLAEKLRGWFSGPAEANPTKRGQQAVDDFQK